MKKILAGFLAVVLAGALSGCSDLDELTKLLEQSSEKPQASDNKPMESSKPSVPEMSGDEESSVPEISETDDKYNVAVHIDFVHNAIFSTYDVDMSVDGVKQQTIKHGTDSDFTLALTEGEHTISFVNVDDAGVDGSVSFNVNGDMKVSYKISCHYYGVDIEDETPNALGGESEPISSGGIGEEPNVSGGEQISSGNIEANFPVEAAKRAAVVALTNGYANDVFTDDGSYFDPAKLHTYADLSGYYMTVQNEGTWTAKSENTWHVEGLILVDSVFSNKTNAALDITFDGTNYVASNLKGSFGTNNDISSLESEPDSFKNNYLVVKPGMISKDREGTSQNEEESIGIYFYHKAFEEYGISYYPYGFECHWTLGRIAEEKYSDGSYFFKVEVTVTNAYNAKRKTVAEGKVKYVNGSFTVDSFYVS